MRIAIIAWGSIVWEPRALPYEDDWEHGGPTLPLEFSRVSRNCRLTLVIDGQDGMQCATRYALSNRAALSDAIADLRDREGTLWSRIGYVDLASGTDSSAEYAQPPGTFDVIAQWCKRHAFESAVWTALCPSFMKEIGKDFSVVAATCHISSLPAQAKKAAIEYFNKAPEEIVTPLREHLAHVGLIRPREEWGDKLHPRNPDDTSHSS